MGVDMRLTRRDAMKAVAFCLTAPYVAGKLATPTVSEPVGATPSSTNQKPKVFGVTNRFTLDHLQAHGREFREYDLEFREAIDVARAMSIKWPQEKWIILSDPFVVRELFPGRVVLNGKALLVYTYGAQFTLQNLNGTYVWEELQKA